jgi:hypothetical protein
MMEKSATLSAPWPGHVESAVLTDKSNGSALPEKPNGSKIALNARSIWEIPVKPGSGKFLANECAIAVSSWDSWPPAITELRFGHGTYLSNGGLCGPVSDAKPACQMVFHRHLAGQPDIIGIPD